jgi:hypothetical protein
LPKANDLKGINFQKVKIGSEIALPFLFLSFGNHHGSLHLRIVEQAERSNPQKAIIGVVTIFF